jgi:hypothetical protein
MNRVALGLLVAAFLSFAAFHFLPGFGEVEACWRVWLEVREMIADMRFFADPGDFATLSAFLMITLLIVASPFLLPVFRGSRLAWWLATLMSGLALFSLWILVMADTDPATLGPAGWCLLAAPAFHLIGMTLIRGHRHGEETEARPENQNGRR